MTKNKGRDLTTMPPTLVEAEALASVRRLLEQLRPDMSTEASRDFLRELLGNAVSHSAQSMGVTVTYARAGDELCDRIVHDLWREASNRGERPPTVVAAYIQDKLDGLLEPRDGRGRRKADNIRRDILIALLIEHVTFRFGLKPTRNNASKRPSACSVVAQALAETRGLPGLTERAVAVIWTRLGRVVRPHRPMDPFERL